MNTKFPNGLHRRPKSRRALQALFAATFISALSSPLRAFTKIWLGANGAVWNGSNTGNWSGGTVPANGDDVIMNTSNPNVSNPTASFFGVYNPGLQSLTINPTSANATFTLFLNDSSDIMDCTSFEILGDTTSNAILTQTTGQNFTPTLTLGNQTSGGGTYNLSAFASVTTLNVGNSGTGTFNLTGSASMNVSGNMTVGNIGNHASAVTMSGGTLSANNLTIANGAGSSGTFTQTGGAISINASLIMAASSGAVASYTMNNNVGASTLSTNVDFIATNGTATFSQSAGTHTTGQIILGYFAGSTATYTLSGGTVNVGTSANPGTIDLGLGSASANINQSGGTMSIQGAGAQLYVGHDVASAGNYTLAGTLTCATENIGYSGNGFFTQNTGSTNTVGQLNLGTTAASTASYTLSDGTVTVGTVASPGHVSLGTKSTHATITQSGGLMTFAGTNNAIYIGDNAGSAGTYALSGGTLYCESEYIGLGGTGTVTQTGGTNTLTNSNSADIRGLYVGYGGSGTYTLNSNTSAATLNSVQEEIGLAATGAFTQSGNTLNSTNTLLIDSLGTYTLSGGNLSYHSSFTLCTNTGVFNQNGGSVNLFISNRNTYAFTSGSFTGQFTNESGATFTLSTNPFFDSEYGFVNNAVLTIAAGKNFGGESLNNSGTFTNAGTLTIGISGRLTNSGTLNQSGPQSWLANATSLSGFVSNSGTAVFSTDIGSSTSRNSVFFQLFGGAIKLFGPQHLASINFQSGTETLDVSGDVFLHSGNYNTLASEITSGTIFTSSSKTGAKVALITGSSFLAVNHSGLRNGQSVLSSDILLSLAYGGDTDLDGKITIDDYLRIDDAFARHLTNNTWANGNVNYDGTINAADYAAIDTSYKFQSGTLADGAISQHLAQFGQPYIDAYNALNPASPIPEPASLTLLLLAAPGLLSRRRRHNR